MIIPTPGLHWGPRTGVVFDMACTLHIETAVRRVVAERQGVGQGRSPAASTAALTPLSGSWCRGGIWVFADSELSALGARAAETAVRRLLAEREQGG
jgi:hypothetical protein